MKTQDNKSIFIVKNEAGNLLVLITKLMIMVSISVENSHIENQNIYISGITNSQINNIEWEFIKI